MNEKIAIPIPRRVIKLMDENRGDMSREEFIEICVNRKLRMKPKIKTETETETKKKNKIEERRIKEEGPPTPTPVVTPFVSEAEEKEGVERERVFPPWKSAFDHLWLIAFLLYGIGDTITSYVALRNAGFFGNPLLRLLFNDNFYPVIPFKIAFLLSLFLISYLALESRISLIFPIALSIVGFFLIINNLLYSIGI